MKIFFCVLFFLFSTNAIFIENIAFALSGSPVIKVIKHNGNIDDDIILNVQDEKGSANYKVYLRVILVLGYIEDEKSTYLDLSEILEREGFVEKASAHVEEIYDEFVKIFTGYSVKSFENYEMIEKNRSVLRDKANAILKDHNISPRVIDVMCTKKRVLQDGEMSKIRRGRAKPID